ncbi:hypothetical protein AB8879_09985 [Alphaproteobacteria bacterium LSUCC0744]
MTEVTIDELKQARYMSLTSPPASPEAKRLVDSIIDIILDTEQRKRARTPSAAVAFKSAVGLIVGDLLIGLKTREVGWSYLSLSTAAFSDRPIGYKTFKPIVQAMETAGLIDVSLGRNSQGNDFGFGQQPAYTPGYATRFRPTATMAAMALEAGIVDQAVTKHFPPQLPKRVIEVRAKSENTRGHKVKGKKLKFAHTEKSRAMEAEIKELNRFLVTFELEGAGFSGYRRLFHEGDVEGFDFQWGGRIYGVGDYSYQNMKKSDRPNLKIDGEPIVEIDINASYLSILHGISGYPLPQKDDLYDIGGIDRTIIKAWVSSTIGHHSFHTRWPKNAIQEIEDAGIEKPKEMTMTSLQPVILDHFPMLADWPSGRVTWADLMFTESEIIIGTMLELMRSYGIPCFSVHDSIIVKKKDQQIAMETLESQFLGRTTIEPRLKVK